MKLGRHEILMVLYTCTWLMVRLPKGQIKGGTKKGREGAPFFDKSVLQIRWFQQQGSCIAMISIWFPSKGNYTVHNTQEEQPPLSQHL